jgi:hypothetical protein
MSTLSPSSIKTTKTLEEQLQGVTNSEQIKEIMKSAALEQNLIHRDWDPEILVANEPSAAPQKVSKVFVLNGVKHSLTADDEAGLLAQESAIYRAALAQPVATETPIEQPRNDRGQFTAVEPTVTDEQKAALSLQFQLGQISASEYIEQSGAVSDYLEKSGAIEKHIERREQTIQKTGWESATELFLQSDEGASWPGGQDSLARIGQIIEASGLTETPDKLDALKQAYALMQQEDGEVTARESFDAASQRIGSATSVDEIREALGRSSSMFGR